MDAQTRPQVFGKPQTRFPTPPTAISVLQEEDNRTKTTDPDLEPLSLEANTG